MRVDVEPASLQLRAPLRTSYGEFAARDLLRVRVESGDGLVGHGEAAPLQPYDGVSLERAAAALDRYRPLLEEADDEQERAALLAACWGADPLPHALAAVDTALWDLAGRRAGQPLAALLAERPARGVVVNASIGAEDRAGAAAAATAARLAGFRALKLKVGTGDDAGRLAAVRAAAGPAIQIRIDANGAWTVDQADAALRALAGIGLELAEEPVHGVERLRELRARDHGVRIAMDESAAEPAAVASGACDAVCLKLGRCGGVTGLLEAATQARRSGAAVYVASTYDGPIGIAAALHAAAALGTLPACGLATLGLFEATEDPFVFDDGAMQLPGGPGLGLEPSY